VARNRKRAKERRARRPQPVPGSREQREDATESIEHESIEHAMPDVELAEAQLALGRPDLAEERDEDEAEFELEAEAAVEQAQRDGNGVAGESAAEVALANVPGTAAPAKRPSVPRRLITFLQGSWRELQRVQWPDRRQVVQATGVVIGFVIVAGVFLGVADLLAGKVMNYILTGHFK
jgi:preprotein translocase SecE subunit